MAHLIHSFGRPERRPRYSLTEKLRRHKEFQAIDKSLFQKARQSLGATLDQETGYALRKELLQQIVKAETVPFHLNLDFVLALLLSNCPKVGRSVTEHLVVIAQPTFPIQDYPYGLI